MNVLELFAGSRSIGAVAENMGHTVFSSDIEPFGGINYVTDIRTFKYDRVPFVPDMIWASPPCQGFSVAVIGRNWNYDGTPKTASARLGLELVGETLRLISFYRTKNPNLLFYIENPRGMLRKMKIMESIPRHTVSYCQYGDTRMKPTDIWTNNPKWIPRPMCKRGDTCHEAAPRGSRTGTQGREGAYERSRIPAALCKEIIEAT